MLSRVLALVAFLVLSVSFGSSHRKEEQECPELRISPTARFRAARGPLAPADVEKFRTAFLNACRLARETGMPFRPVPLEIRVDTATDLEPNAFAVPPDGKNQMVWAYVPREVAVSDYVPVLFHEFGHLSAIPEATYGGKFADVFDVVDQLRPLETPADVALYSVLKADYAKAREAYDRVLGEVTRVYLEGEGDGWTPERTAARDALNQQYDSVAQAYSEAYKARRGMLESRFSLVFGDSFEGMFSGVHELYADAFAVALARDAKVIERALTPLLHWYPTALRLKFTETRSLHPALYRGAEAYWSQFAPVPGQTREAHAAFSPVRGATGRFLEKRFFSPQSLVRVFQAGIYAYRDFVAEQVVHHSQVPDLEVINAHYVGYLLQ
jgi:hypothetical protein